MPGIAYNLIVLRVGELFLKGDNRRHFVALLEGNIRRALIDLPSITMERGQGRLFVTCPPEDLERALERVRHVSASPR